MLLTIAGSSCSGKTTAASACADLDHMVVHDFDEIGVPSTADTRWRQRGMETWLRRVLDYQDRGSGRAADGAVAVRRGTGKPSAIHLDGIAACLLDVADDERWRRLERRDPGRWHRDAKRSFIRWARWHRGHAADPQCRPQVLTTGGWEQMQWARWSAWTSDDPRWTVTVIDTTGQSVEHSTAALQQWVGDVRAHSGGGRLALAQGWIET
jgi:hypothetical protein